MILPPDEDLQQIARQANPDEMMVIIAWPNPIKNISPQQKVNVLEPCPLIPRPV